MSHLSPREQEVLYMVAHEMTADEIAKELFISNHTVISHRQNLLFKLQARNTAGLVRRAFELGFLSLPSS